ncbi:MAG: hypothetical protein BWX69_03264 [Planctomycetes bacterium ADurb.Bin069]|nr:MAG: hypothetical protein BWX69_03264 [Planctomycetes bacterium ADurb.Bin069]
MLTASRRLSPAGDAAAEPEPPPLSDQSSRSPSSAHAPAESWPEEIKYCCHASERLIRKDRSSTFVQPCGSSSANGSAIFQTVRLGCDGWRKATEAVRDVTPPYDVTVSVWAAVE